MPAGVARRPGRGKLREWDLGDLTGTAELILSELVANAARHTRRLTTMRVRIRHIDAGAVRISVRDGSRTLPMAIQAGNEDEGHRGMALVNRLAKGCWGADLDPRGKTVHATLKIR
ncbi:ATP-binding protein [Kitasatospora sp. NPDC001132]